jgi:hypothetical protein
MNDASRLYLYARPTQVTTESALYDRWRRHVVPSYFGSSQAAAWWSP